MKYKIIAIVLVLVAVGAAGFYYGSDLLRGYAITSNNFQQFQKTDLGQLVAEIKKEVLAPLPLHIGGKANSAVFTKEKVITQTNLARSENGQLSALVENEKLDAAALAKANDLFKNQYFEHVSPSGVDPGMLVKNSGYAYIVSGENLILGNFKDEKEMVDSWMQSPGHRANILNNRFVDIGVAVVKGAYKGETVWIGVQEFGLPSTACSEPNVKVKMEIENNKAKLDALSSPLENLRQQISDMNPHSKEYNQLVDQYNELVRQYNALNDATKQLVSQHNAQVKMFNACVAGG